MDYNARVMENYCSLAFFCRYDAPWNIYYRSADALWRLEMALNYTFDLMEEVLLRYADLGFSKTYVLCPDAIHVLVGRSQVAGASLSECIFGRTGYWVRIG